MPSNDVLCFTYLEENSAMRNLGQVAYIGLDYITSVNYYILQSTNTNLTLLDL